MLITHAYIFKQFIPEQFMKKHTQMKNFHYYLSISEQEADILKKAGLNPKVMMPTEDGIEAGCTPKYYLIVHTNAPEEAFLDRDDIMVNLSYGEVPIGRDDKVHRYAFFDEDDIFLTEEIEGICRKKSKERRFTRKSIERINNGSN